jgi:hypothetical protein
LYALLQQQQFKKSSDLIDRGPTQERDSNGQEVRAILQLTTEPLLLSQKNDGAGICDHSFILGIAHWPLLRSKTAFGPK